MSQHHPRSFALPPTPTKVDDSSTNRVDDSSTGRILFVVSDAALEVIKKLVAAGSFRIHPDILSMFITYPPKVLIPLADECRAWMGCFDVFATDDDGVRVVFRVLIEDDCVHINAIGPV